MPNRARQAGRTANQVARRAKKSLDFDVTSNPIVWRTGQAAQEIASMFRIGEFSQVARVSGRLLRYYDSIGLLHPVRIDPQTGYRYYSASQLPRLNRILALKELGLASNRSHG
jgi:MerR HTH family regulatory protein